MKKEPHWDAVGPPPLTLFAQEQVRALGDFMNFRARRRLASQAPRGDGHPVLVLPGFLAPEFSTAPLRNFLRDLCYDARNSHLGVNLGPNEKVNATIESRLVHLAERHGRKVSLVGWSLGGIYAREVARAHPEMVRMVISMGTPFADISATHAARFIPLRPEGKGVHESQELRAALRRPLEVPTTSIYSRTDGIVHWQGCLQQDGPQNENVEVHCSHTGMGFHPEVFRVVADRLALPEGEWRPYRRAD
jgi:pimeloyl-ACP methyl ester carboxylesterase